MANVSRRRILKWAVCCGAGAGLVDALVIEPRWLSVTSVTTTVPGLPAALEGLTIAHLSDLHLSSLGMLHDRLLEELRAASPTLTVVTGDLIEDNASIGVATELLSELVATGSTVLCTMGNWEAWGGVDVTKLEDACKRAGATLLHNKSHLVDAGIGVYALGDACSRNEDVLATFSRRLQTPLKLLLTHAPGIVDDLPEHATFDLGLAGHTHGGQVRPGFTLWTPPGSGRFVHGIYETPRGPLYVSRGVGTSVLATRFACRPELALHRLQRG